ncbi:MAG: cation:proton antiporter [Candidatus Omnitrophica bacterium]|nr:cation:proton antiporter [Candidatus Omnitrophota bacterium]
MHHFTEQHIFIFLVQIFLLLGLARALGELFRRWNQPPLTAEILVGILLGPTILGRFSPSVFRAIFPPDAIQISMLETTAWLGVFFLLLETGLEIDFSSAWRQRGDALKIALSDIIVPILIAFVSCLFLPERYLADPSQRLIFTVFLATVMTISAMPIAARALHDLGLFKTDLGFLIMSALSVNDIIGWLIFTMVLGLFTQANLDILRVGFILISTGIFIVFCLTFLRRFTDSLISKVKSKGLPEPATSLTLICLLGILCGAFTQRIGIHALFGFFIAGIVSGEARALPERTRQVISQMVYAIFVPLFFANIGLKIDFLKNFDLFLVLFITVIGISARFLGAWLGVGLTELSRSNRLSIAIAHTPGGSMEVVIGILALEYNLITEPVFVAIVFGAVISSVLLGPWLKYSITKRKEISVLEFFAREQIIPELRAKDRDGAIYELCSLVSEKANMPNSESIYSAVLQRENMMGTAIEEGIALPHARFDSIIKPVVAFARSVPGIDWNSPDGKSTHLIFLILTPKRDDDVQIQTLRIISKTMQYGSDRDRLMKVKDISGIWDVFLELFGPHSILRKK